ncbi:hypothetical protein EWM64_g6122 [Hericium alpestre]|uniref:Uncharacterized protein n=1 Tax=Hericium alpestre TaxID=135208 RepID=A0A4Y9ZWM0_9AGAM|nr:hypothetical protein EWM64_g6122 [Hericium alpestre]
MINELCKDAIEFFTSVFPSSLTSYCTSTVRHSAAELMQAIKIGSQCHVLAILPTATYAAAILPITATLDLDDHLATLKAWHNCMIFREQLVSHIELPMKSRVRLFSIKAGAGGSMDALHVVSPKQ